jgi:hypothetical protein
MDHGDAPTPPVVLLVGGDLMARTRLEAAAAHAGAELLAVPPDALEGALERRSPSLVVLDLDNGGEDLLKGLTAARTRALVPDRVVGYFSHVDTRLGDAARAAGCEALPRGRFWRSLEELFSP